MQSTQQNALEAGALQAGDEVVARWKRLIGELRRPLQAPRPKSPIAGEPRLPTPPAAIDLQRQNKLSAGNDRPPRPVEKFGQMQTAAVQSAQQQIKAARRGVRLRRKLERIPVHGVIPTKFARARLSGGLLGGRGREMVKSEREIGDQKSFNPIAGRIGDDSDGGFAVKRTFAEEVGADFGATLSDIRRQPASECGYSQSHWGDTLALGARDHRSIMPNSGSSAENCGVFISLVGGRGVRRSVPASVGASAGEDFPMSLNCSIRFPALVA